MADPLPTAVSSTLRKQSLKRSSSVRVKKHSKRELGSKRSSRTESSETRPIIVETGVLESNEVRGGSLLARSGEGPVDEEKRMREAVSDDGGPAVRVRTKKKKYHSVVPVEGPMPQDLIGRRSRARPLSTTSDKNSGSTLGGAVLAPVPSSSGVLESDAASPSTESLLRQVAPLERQGSANKEISGVSQKSRPGATTAVGTVGSVVEGQEKTTVKRSSHTHHSSASTVGGWHVPNSQRMGAGSSSQRTAPADSKVPRSSPIPQLGPSSSSSTTSTPSLSTPPETRDPLLAIRSRNKPTKIGVSPSSSSSGSKRRSAAKLASSSAHKPEALDSDRTRDTRSSHGVLPRGGSPLSLSTGSSSGSNRATPDLRLDDDAASHGGARSEESQDALVSATASSLWHTHLELLRSLDESEEELRHDKSPVAISPSHLAHGRLLAPTMLQMLKGEKNSGGITDSSDEANVLPQTSTALALAGASSIQTPTGGGSGSPADSSHTPSPRRSWTATNKWAISPVLPTVLQVEDGGNRSDAELRSAASSSCSSHGATVLLALDRPSSISPITNLNPIANSLLNHEPEPSNDQISSSTSRPSILSSTQFPSLHVKCPTSVRLTTTDSAAPASNETSSLQFANHNFTSGLQPSTSTSLGPPPHLFFSSRSAFAPKRTTEQPS